MRFSAATSTGSTIPSNASPGERRRPASARSWNGPRSPRPRKSQPNSQKSWRPDVPALLRMPAIAAGAETAILSEWQVQEGVPFGKTDTLATVETDKALVDMEAEESGVILRFL